MIPKKYHERLAVFGLFAGVIMVLAGMATSELIYFLPGGFCLLVSLLYLHGNKKTK